MSVTINLRRAPSRETSSFRLSTKANSRPVLRLGHYFYDRQSTEDLKYLHYIYVSLLRFSCDSRKFFLIRRSSEIHIQWRVHSCGIDSVVKNPKRKVMFLVTAVGISNVTRMSPLAQLFRLMRN